jgi:hypothetical protein
MRADVIAFMLPGRTSQEHQAPRRLTCRQPRSAPRWGRWLPVTPAACLRVLVTFAVKCRIQSGLLPASGSPPSLEVPSEDLGSISTKSQVPSGGSPRASSQSRLASARITPAHATRPIRSQQGRPPAALAPLD